MKISVVIPLYNKEMYIRRAIDSVFSQSKGIFEVVVVNDGSTDNSLNTVKEIKNVKLKIIDQGNKGESAARNRGILAANGEFIAFLDADDEWLPDFIEVIETLILNFPDCGAYATSSMTMKPNGSINFPKLDLLPSEPWIGIIPNFFELFQDGMAFNSSSIVIPKKVLMDIGGFPENMKHTPDLDCWVRIAIKYPIAFSPKRKSIYHQEAMFRTAYNHSPIIDMPVLNTINQLIKNGKISSPALKFEAMEYIAQKKIHIAINNIIIGQNKKGRSILKKIEYSKKYKKVKMMWFLLSFLPTKVLKALVNLKSKIH